MLSFPTNPVNGNQYTDPNGKVWEFDGVKWNIAVADSSKEFYGVKVSLTQQQFLSSTLTTIAFDSADIDTTQFFDPSIPTKLVIPRTGYYRVNLAVVAGQEGFGASYTIELRRNGSNIAEDLIGAFQSARFDQTILLNAGDELELYAAEQESIGSLVEGTYLEIQLQGYTFGGAITPGFEFSGVKAQLNSEITTTSTSTAISWDNIIFNINANEAGDLYWDDLEDTKFTIATTGYYRVRTFFETGTDGSDDSYVIVIKKNGVDLETISIGPNDTADLDETYQFTATDYLQVFVRNTDNLGTILFDNTFFEVIRLGV